jgi:hypothetical protein
VINLTRLTGINWYKWGGIAAVLAAALILSYCSGRYQAKLACEEDKTEAAEERVVAITRYVTERVTEVQTKEVKSRKELDEIARLKRELDDATNQRQDLPECALSDSEFDAVNRLLQR